MIRREIPSLDGWRALAVGLVLVAHASQCETGHLWDAGHGWGGWVFDPVGVGVLGVRVFFVLSGFLITKLLLAERAKTGRIALGAFYFRRTFRIAPALFVFLAVLGAMTWAGWVPVSGRDLLTSALYLRDYADGSWYTWHLWSLAVEEQFYLLWPGILALATRARRGAWGAPLVALALVPLIRVAELHHYGWANAWPLDSHFENVADALATGVLLAYTSDWLAEQAWYRRWLASPAPWLLVPVPYLALWGNWTWHAKPHALLGIPIANVALALLVDWTIRRPETAAGRVLNVAPVRFVGRVSYSLYLWQQIALRLVPAHAPDVFIPFVPRVLATLPGCYLLALALAVASYYGVEQPLLSVRTKLMAWWNARRSASLPRMHPQSVPVDALGDAP